ncbi:PP2C family protein-serine/threonine phosphatase [Saccharothrix yanglingensis]|uniref:Protein phosphatase n=1 Tax=Saccharothrix yanglingensis TaxID=659496 RepID=A0ABU0X5J8_9PSEU|nr:protein phosphatase 2C domain-containing protein [Saccharothrix yanglingensis]MDQ2587286.1 protein phosphatase [Saccharothrix yanglingensis]
MTGVLDTGWATSTGLVRASNQDSALVGTRLFAVADGMGGHAAGEVASAMATAHLRLLDERADLGPDGIRLALTAANAAIRAAATENPEQAGMGSTVTGLALVSLAGSPHWVVFNIGDSRVYRYAAGALTLLTEDHSETAEMVASGALTPEQARTSPRRHVITRTLGSVRSEPDQWVFPAVGGDRFLLCSDGLTGELEDTEVAEVLRNAPDAQRAADELVRRAVAAGGRDNVTVVVVDHRTAVAASEDTAPRSAR